MTRDRFSIIAVGLGSIFEHAHLPMLRGFPYTKSISGVEIIEARRNFWKKNDPRIKIFQCLDEALEKDQYDCAVVTNYPKGRYEVLEQLYRAGIQTILCEKPLDTSIEGINRIRDLVAKPEFTLIPCHTWAYSPLALVLESYSEKLISPPAKINVLVERTGPALGAREGNPLWRIDPRFSGGGILFDHGYHCLYLAQRWTKEDFSPTEVKSQCDRNGIDWYTRATFESLTGTRLEMVLTWKGTRRRVSYRLASNGSLINANEDNMWIETSDQSRHEVYHGDPISVDGSHSSWYQGLYFSLFEALLNGVNTSHLDEEAISVNRSILKAYQMMHSTPEGIL